MTLVKSAMALSCCPMFLFQDLIIYSDFTIGRCCADLNARMTYGNLFKDFNGSVVEAFRDWRREQHREMMNAGVYLAGCSECERYGIGEKDGNSNPNGT